MVYFDKQWIKRVDADSFSVYKRVRRTNDSESFHAALQRILKIRGPAVWEFTDGLRNITANTARELRAFLDEGIQIRNLGKRTYRENNRRIREATALLDENGEVGAFLEMVSYCVENIVQEHLASDEEEGMEEQLLGTLPGVIIPQYANANEDGADGDDVEFDGDEFTDMDVDLHLHHTDMQGHIPAELTCVACLRGKRMFVRELCFAVQKAAARSGRPTLHQVPHVQATHCQISDKNFLLNEIKNCKYAHSLIIRVHKFPCPVITPP